MVGSWSADLFAQTLKHIVGYVGQTYQHGDDTCWAVKSLVCPHLPTPHALPGASAHADPVVQAIFQEQIKEYVKRSNNNREKCEVHTKGTTGNTMMQKSLLWAPC